MALAFLSDAGGSGATLPSDVTADPEGTGAAAAAPYLRVAQEPSPFVKAIAVTGVAVGGLLAVVLIWRGWK